MGSAGSIGRLFVCSYWSRRHLKRPRSRAFTRHHGKHPGRYFLERSQRQIEHISHHDRMYAKEQYGWRWFGASVEDKLTEVAIEGEQPPLPTAGQCQYASVVQAWRR